MSDFSKWFKRATGAPEKKLRDLPGDAGKFVRGIEGAAMQETVNGMDAVEFAALCAIVDARKKREAAKS